MKTKMLRTSYLGMNRLLALLIAVFVGGCASTQRMGIDDLNRFQIDCNNKDAQIRFLQSQLTTSDERVMAVFRINLLTELSYVLNGTQSENTRIASGQYDSIARTLIWKLESYCPSLRYAGDPQQPSAVPRGARDPESKVNWLRSK